MARVDPFIATHLALYAITALVLFALAVLSFCHARRKGDPLRRGLNSFRLSVMLLFVHSIIQVAGNALIVQISIRHLPLLDENGKIPQAWNTLMRLQTAGYLVYLLAQVFFTLGLSQLVVANKRVATEGKQVSHKHNMFVGFALLGATILMVSSAIFDIVAVGSRGGSYMTLNRIFRIVMLVAWFIVFVVGAVVLRQSIVTKGTTVRENKGFPVVASRLTTIAGVAVAVSLWVVINALLMSFIPGLYVYGVHQGALSVANVFLASWSFVGLQIAVYLLAKKKESDGGLWSSGTPGKYDPAYAAKYAIDQ